MLANSELLSITIDKGKVGVGPVLVTQGAPDQWSEPQHPDQTVLGTTMVDYANPNPFTGAGPIPALCLA